MFTANFGPALAELALLRARIAFPQPVLALIGRKAVARVQHEIESGKHDPDGHPWAGWAQPRRRHPERGILWEEGTLLHSIGMQVGLHEVTVGTNVPYAGFLQDGTGRMPARQFLGWSDEAEREAEHTMIEYLEGAAL